MRRFFIDKKSITDAGITIDGEQYAHLNKVLRIAEGDEIIACCGDGVDYICTVEKSTKTGAFCRVNKKVVSSRETKCSVTLFQGLPKGDKLEFIAQKATELGVSKIVPFSSAFTEKKWQQEKKERYQKIIIEACKQCGRSVVPEFCDAIDIGDLSKRISDFDIVIFANERESEHTLSELLENKQNIAIIIGAEGGFSQDEAESLVNNGAKSVTLGPRILRTETASVSLLAVVMFQKGEWK